MFSWNQSLTLALDRSFNRPSSTHLQNTQMATITSLAPLGLAGLILTMLSSAHIKKGYSPFSQGSRNGGLGNLALSNCLGLLLVLRHMQSLRIPIQKYLGLSASYSLPVGESQGFKCLTNNFFSFVHWGHLSFRSCPGIVNPHSPVSHFYKFRCMQYSLSFIPI